MAIRAAAEPSQCGFGSPWKFKADPDRFTSCGEVWWEVATYEEHDDGTIDITGSLNLNNRQWNVYDKKTLTWTHDLTIQTHEGEGTLADGTPATTESLCRSLLATCKVVSGDSPQVLVFVPNTRFSFHWVEEAVGVRDDVAADNVVPQDALGVQLTSTGTTDVPSWQFTDADLWGRCDNTIEAGSATKPGCVNPYFTPSLKLLRATRGAAADMLAWAQRNLPGKWGLKSSGKPLHRLTDSIIIKDNRDVLCDARSGWMQDPGLNNALKPYPPRNSRGDPEIDSCDEYPFAASFESGPMAEGADGQPKPHVRSGAECAQVIAEKTGSSQDLNLAADFNRVKPLGQPTGLELCVRGHVPVTLNSAVGSDYQAEIRNSRILNKDAFWVQIA